MTHYNLVGREGFEPVYRLIKSQLLITLKLPSYCLERLIGFEPILKRWQRFVLPLNTIDTEFFLRFYCNSR